MSTNVLSFFKLISGNNVFFLEQRLISGWLEACFLLSEAEGSCQ